MTVRRLVVAALVVAATSAVLVGVAVAARPDRAPPRPERVSLQLSGEAGGLHPGGTVTVPVVVSNPYPFTVRITELAVTASGASPACPASVLTVEAPVGDTVAANGSTTVAVAVRMAMNAPNACQGATFPLDYSVAANRT